MRKSFSKQLSSSDEQDQGKVVESMQTHNAEYLELIERELEQLEQEGIITESIGSDAKIRYLSH